MWRIWLGVGDSGRGGVGCRARDVREAMVMVLKRGDGSTFGEHVRALTMRRVAKLEQQARTKARQRRIAMDYDRATRDKRVEGAAA